MSFQAIQPSDLNPMAEVILAVESLDHDCFAGGRCVNEPLAAQIDSNMPGSLADPEKHEITRQRPLNIEPVRGVQLFTGGTWHQQARFAVGIEHETATVKTPWIIPAVVIGNTDHPLSRECNAFKNEGVTRFGRWSAGSDIRWGSQVVRRRRCERRGSLGCRNRDRALHRLRRVIAIDGAGAEHEQQTDQTGSHNSESLEHRPALPVGWDHPTKMG
jgi:hypothetical protein